MIKYNTDLYTQPEDAIFGELQNLITPELIALCKESKHILIYGHTKSGKVILGKLLAKELNCDLIISDDYQHLGWEQNMYYIKNELLQKKYKDLQVVFEGVQTCRALRKGVQMNDYFPDLVIHVTCSYECIRVCYCRSGERKKLKGWKVKRFNEEILDKIFFNWWDILPIEKRPKIININTTFKLEK